MLQCNIEFFTGWNGLTLKLPRDSFQLVQLPTTMAMEKSLKVSASTPFAGEGGEWSPNPPMPYGALPPCWARYLGGAHSPGRSWAVRAVKQLDGCLTVADLLLCDIYTYVCIYIYYYLYIYIFIFMIFAVQFLWQGIYGQCLFSFSILVL
jgi:hypothetical protein